MIIYKSSSHILNALRVRGVRHAHSGPAELRLRPSPILIFRPPWYYNHRYVGLQMTCVSTPDAAHLTSVRVVILAKQILAVLSNRTKLVMCRGESSPVMMLIRWGI